MTLSFELTSTEIERYSRQLLLKDWDIKQQLKLKNAVVACDSNYKLTLRYLTAAGIGTIISDFAEENFLKELQELNPEIEIKKASFPLSGKISLNNKPLITNLEISTPLSEIIAALEIIKLV